MRSLGRAEPDFPGSRHVTGQELARGIADYGRDRFGPLARAVFAHWGIRETLDFGHIVFSLVDNGLMGRTDEDSLEDFRDVYDFDEAFAPRVIQARLRDLDLDRL